MRELNALAFVRFLEEILKAPTVFAHAEQYEHKAAQRQQIGRNKEVFHIHNVAALTQRLNAGKHIKAENRRQGKHRDQHKVYAHGLFAAPTADIHEECENLLEHRNDGRKRRKRHEDEEQRAPNSAARHIVEERRQRDEQQRRTRARLHPVGKAHRDNDETRHQRNKRVQQHNVHRFARNAIFAVQIAAEDLHGADADGKREERLRHRRKHRVAEAFLCHFTEVRHKVELDACRGIRQKCGVHSQCNHQKQQGNHHDLCHFLNALLQAKAACTERNNNSDNRPERQRARICQHIAEHALYRLAVQADKRTGCLHKCVFQHPAAHHGVEHHQQKAAENADPLHAMPFRALRFQCIERLAHAHAAAAAHGEFAHHNGQTQHHKEHKIHQDECRAAVYAGNVWEFPHIADADGAPGRN